MVAAAKSEHTVQVCIADIERRIANREARIIADLIKGRDPTEAQDDVIEMKMALRRMGKKPDACERPRTAR